MAERTFVLLSVPSDFADKLLGFVNNINALNKKSTLPVKIERIYKKNPKHAATPEGTEKKVAARFNKNTEE